MSTTAPLRTEEYHCVVTIDPALPGPLNSSQMWVKGDMIYATVGFHRLEPPAVGARWVWQGAMPKLGDDGVRRRRIEAGDEPARTSRGERYAMSEDSTVVRLRQPEEIDDPLTAVLRSGRPAAAGAGDRGGSRGLSGRDAGAASCRTGVSGWSGTAMARSGWSRPGSGRSRCSG